MMITRQPKYKSMTFNFANFPLPSGRYEMMPFLNPSHQALPEGLVESFGDFAFAPSAYFLELPFEREYSLLEVTN